MKKKIFLDSALRHSQTPSPVRRNRNLLHSAVWSEFLLLCSFCLHWQQQRQMIKEERTDHFLFLLHVSSKVLFTCQVGSVHRSPSSSLENGEPSAQTMCANANSSSSSATLTGSMIRSAEKASEVWMHAGEAQKKRKRRNLWLLLTLLLQWGSLLALINSSCSSSSSPFSPPWISWWDQVFSFSLSLFLSLTHDRK